MQYFNGAKTRMLNANFIKENLSHPNVGVGDGHREMHRLHDVLQFFETSLKNRIVKN